MKRLIAVLFLVAVLITIATLEQVYVNNFLYQLDIKSQQVSQAIEVDDKNLEREDVKNSFEDLNKFWHNAKNKLCYFTNYEKIKSVDESFVKLSTAIENNDSSLAIENIAVIKEYRNLFTYFMGFNINNLF